MEEEKDDNLDELSEEQANIKRFGKAARLAPWMFKPGQSGNPSGRKPGESLKEYAKRFLACMTDEEKEKFMKGMNKDIIWKMAEGNPDTKTEHSGKIDFSAPTPEDALLAQQIKQLKQNGNNSGTNQPSEGSTTELMGGEV